VLLQAALLVCSTTAFAEEQLAVATELVTLIVAWLPQALVSGLHTSCCSMARM